jgi:hypothetical protein
MTNDQWQPIETAPVDVEIITVYSKQYSFDDKPTVYGPCTAKFNGKRWMASHEDSPVVEYMDYGGTDYQELEIDPTHWMPLPDAPTDNNTGD